MFRSLRSRVASERVDRVRRLHVPNDGESEASSPQPSRLLLQVDAARVCMIEVTLVLYQRGPGLPAGGNAAETGPDAGEGCWRKKGPGGGGGRPCVPKPPTRVIFALRCSPSQSRMESRGSGVVFWCRSADRKSPPWR